MPLTPADVANKLFGKEFRGYAMDEVDAFLDEVESELTRLLTENSVLSRGAAAPVALEKAPPPVAAEPAPGAALTPGEPQQAALRTLLMAQRTADQAIAEARAEADAMLAQAQARSRQLEQEVNARTTAALAALEDRRRELEARIEDLRAFEREYRLRLKAYLASQLKDLDSRGGGGADDAGTGVPAAARAAAVGVMPAGVTDSSASRPAPPAAPASPPAPVAPRAPATPPVPVPAAAPASPGVPVPAAAPTGPAVPVTPAAPATPEAVAVAPELSAFAAGLDADGDASGDTAPRRPAAGRSFPGLAPEFPDITPADAAPLLPPTRLPQLAPDPDPAPAGPPREAPLPPPPPSLRAVPPLASEPEPVGPFTIVPPPVQVEQVDDGPEPPAPR